jgi:signal transduction histidine kinase
VDLNRILERAVHFVSPENRGISVQLALSPSAPPVIGDPDRLHEAFLNLILNAVEAMAGREQRRLAVSSKALDEGLEVRVSDTGVGIAPEDMDRIYEPFFSRRSDGFGLGLAIARSVITECGGRLSCTSEVGAGTTFYAWLPTGTEEQRDASGTQNSGR